MRGEEEEEKERVRGEEEEEKERVRGEEEEEKERVRERLLSPTQFTSSSSSYLNTIRGSGANHISSSDGDIVGHSWSQSDVSNRSTSLIDLRTCQVSDCDIVASDVSIV